MTHVPGKDVFYLVDRCCGDVNRVSGHWPWHHLLANEHRRHIAYFGVYGELRNSSQEIQRVLARLEFRVIQFFQDLL